MTLTILEGTTFCICDDRGDVGDETSGFFADDTRYLSVFRLTIDGRRPLLLTSDKVEYYSQRLIVDALEPCCERSPVRSPGAGHAIALEQSARTAPQRKASLSRLPQTRELLPENSIVCGSWTFEKRLVDNELNQTTRVAKKIAYLNIADQGEPGPWLTPGVWEKATLPIQVGPEHITMFEGSPAESLAGRWAILNGHCLLIHVAFGVAAPAKQQIAIANGVLATFAIAARLAVIQ